jgi:uncharacterized protein YaaN involved in tellurite resistance
MSDMMILPDIQLEPTKLEKAKDIARTIDPADSRSVLQFGQAAQSKVAQFADTVLEQVRAKDAGRVGEVLTELLVSVKSIGVDSLGSDTFISRIPLIGGLVDSVKRFIARYDKLSVQVEKIVGELESARMVLIRDVTLLDGMYTYNEEYLLDLDLYIAAGKLKLEEVRSGVLVELKAKAATSGDPMDAQKYSDKEQAVNRFEKRLHDLVLSRMIAIQTAPQIRLIQSADQGLVEKIQSSILTTIPLWKNQIVIAISLLRQKKALELQKKVTQTTNDLLAKNAELIRSQGVEVARESERGIVDIETLKKVNADLVATIEETLRIQADGREKRALAEVEIRKLESDLAARMTTSTSR